MFLVHLSADFNMYMKFGGHRQAINLLGDLNIYT